MKTLVFAGFMMCIGMLAIADDPKPIKLYIEDFAFLEGEWEGELEYLDYQDNQTKIKLPLTLVITKKTSAEDYTQYLHIKVTFKEPNGSLSIKEDDLTIMKDGKGIILDGEWKATQKKVMKDKKKHEFVFVGNKKDNNIQSQIRQSMTLADEVLAVKVEVKHENTDEWFVRSNYILTKKK